jgi:hypothetical protein
MDVSSSAFALEEKARGILQADWEMEVYQLAT